ncbi:hypothetical protein AURDEDRAFT_120074 [Auricularia subglabra TFB-10046 SS5]|nr:hypothetical protein AURDEDRAFT_120074 [Auricularia subglabra TFB-10046 SS5]
MAWPFNANDAMDADNAPSADANEEKADPLFGLPPALEPNMQDNWQPAGALFPELENPEFGAPCGGVGADDVVASAEAAQTAGETTSSNDAGSHEDTCTEDTSQGEPVTPWYWCTGCPVVILYPTEQECQAHIEHGQHIYQENDPAQDEVSLLTRDYERAIDQLEAHAGFIFYELILCGRPESILFWVQRIREKIAEYSAEYYRRMSTHFERPGDGPANVLKKLTAHDVWMELYCLIVLGCKPKCKSLAPQFENELRLRRAQIYDVLENGTRLRVIVTPVRGKTPGIGSTHWK